jgi:hypothetical protein
MIVIIAAIMPYLEAGGDSYRRSIGQTANSVLMPSAVEANVTVLGSSSDAYSMAESLEAVSPSVKLISDVENLNPSTKVLCVDCNGLSEERLVEITEAIRGTILRGAPVIFVNDTSGVMARAIEGQNISSVGAIQDGSTPIAVRALKHDPLGGRSGSLDMGGRAGDSSQLAGALHLAYNWSADRLENVNVSGILNEHVHVYEAFSYSYFSGEAYAPYGRFTVSNTYIRTVWNSSYDMDQWSVHYRMESDPGYGVYGNDYRTKAMVVSSTFDDSVALDRYYPGTAYGVDSVEIHLSPNDYGLLSHWEYRIAGVTVINHSNLSLNMFRLDHMPDRGSVVSQSPYIIEPGAGAIVERGAGIEFQESYDLSWEKPSLFAWESRSVSLTVAGSVN